MALFLYYSLTKYCLRIVSQSNLLIKKNISPTDTCYEISRIALKYGIWNKSVGEVGVRIAVFDAAFTNISFISWLSVLLLGEIGENHRPAASHWQTLSFISLCVLVFKINKKALEQREFLFCVHIIQKTEWM